MKKSLATAAVVLSFLSLAGTAHAATGDDTKPSAQTVWIWDCNGDGGGDHISGGGGIGNWWYGRVLNCKLIYVTG